MWGIRQESILNYKSICYIAKKVESTYDDYGNEITTYDKPKKYLFNIQPVSGSSEAQAFGELAQSMKVAVIPKNVYQNMFNEFDVAYLDDISPVGESFYGDNANYRIYSVQPQNAVIRVYFLKIVKGENQL